MNQANMELFEAYKNLEKICSEIYDTKQGVTAYISEMEEVPQSESVLLPGWQQDLRTLKEIRHIRNQLAHDVNAFDEQLCGQEEVAWLEAFYQKIYTQSDPLAMLEKRKQEKQEQQRRAKQAAYRQNQQKQAQNTSPAPAWEQNQASGRAAQVFWKNYDENQESTYQKTADKMKKRTRGCFWFCLCAAAALAAWFIGLNG